MSRGDVSSQIFLVRAVVLACCAPASAASIWYVDDDCSAPTNGTSDRPFCTIQQGVDAASDGDTVLVAAGTYTGPGNRDISLFGKAINLESRAGPQSTILDVQGRAGSVHRGFLLIHGETLETVIRGFTIQNGFVIGDTGGSGPLGGGGGAGLYIRDSSPTVQGCIIRHNVSARLGNPFVHDGRGGGVLVEDHSSALIDRCMIAGNSSGNRGGGIYIGYENSSISLVDCEIIANISGDGVTNFPGGGIYHTFAKSTILNCTIAFNSSPSFGGGVYNEQGELLAANCIIWHNHAAVGCQIVVQGGSFTANFSNVEGGSSHVFQASDPILIWGPGNIDLDPTFFNPGVGDYRLLFGSPCIDAGNNLALPEGVTEDLDGDPRFLDDPHTPDTGNPDGIRPPVDMGAYEYDPNDCNNNDVPDSMELVAGTSQDCRAGYGNRIPDECEADCNANGQADSCDIALRLSKDCTANGVPDECEPDCNANGRADTCDLAAGLSEDCTANGIPDECEADCNENGQADSCDLADRTSPDCNNNAIPDECELADCNANGQLDSCDIDAGLSVDCDSDGVPDECGCPSDLVGNDTTGEFDLAVLLSFWGPCPENCTSGLPSCDCEPDFDLDCTVGPMDLAALLGAWGPCP